MHFSDLLPMHDASNQWKMNDFNGMISCFHLIYSLEAYKLIEI